MVCEYTDSENKNKKAGLVAAVAVWCRGTTHAQTWSSLPRVAAPKPVAHMKMPTQAALADTSDSQSSTAQKILIDLDVSLGWKRKPVLAAAESLPLLCFLRLS